MKDFLMLVIVGLSGYILKQYVDRKIDGMYCNDHDNYNECGCDECNCDDGSSFDTYTTMN